jgi:hypothetical protein
MAIRCSLGTQIKNLNNNSKIKKNKIFYTLDIAYL